jgi:hypothetical protein
MYPYNKNDHDNEKIGEMESKNGYERGVFIASFEE